MTFGWLFVLNKLTRLSNHKAVSRIFHFAMRGLVQLARAPKRFFSSKHSFSNLHEEWMKNYKDGVILEQSTDKKAYDDSDHFYQPWNRIPEKDLKDRYLYKIR